MSAPEKNFDKQLWRDFDWDKYMASEIRRHPSDREKDEFRQSVEAARNVSRLMHKAGPADLRELAAYESTVPPRLFFESLIILAMIANIYYTGKHEEAQKVTFAISTISRLASVCRKHALVEAEPILRAFVLELGEDIGE